MVNEKKVWEITVAKSGCIEIEAETEAEAMKIASEMPLTKLIQWEDSWNIVDINTVVTE